MNENKQNLIQFLTSELLQGTQSLDQTHQVIVGGGSSCPEDAVSSLDPLETLTHLRSSHEEADTRMVIHAVDASHQGYDRLVIQSRDTDVLVLLIHHKHRFPAEVWMSAGTSKNPRFIPINNVVESLAPDIAVALPAYHAITGSDTTSQFSGHGKKSTWNTFISKADLLKPSVDTGSFDMVGAEQFVMKLYNSSSTAADVNALRAEMFHKVGDLEKLPPTQDALRQHLLRSQYQCIIWCSAHKAQPDIPSPEQFGWQLHQQVLKPILMTKEPIPAVCLELVTCRCTTSKCSSSRCNCVKSNIGCSLGCSSAMSCLNINNSTAPHEMESEDDEETS